jgi:homoserine kinase
MLDPESLVGTEIAVPASIANLGPGFDTLGLALQLYLRVRIAAVSSDPRAASTGDLTFDFGEQPVAGDNLIARAFQTLALEEGRRVPALRVEVRSDIPVQRGLGSSAAATVAGLLLYERVFGPLPLERRLEVACRLEGHPDNAGAALLGGLVATCALDGGRVVAVPAPWPPDLHVVVATPTISLSTSAARQVLPGTLSRTDAVFNLQRVALLLQSLHVGDFRHLRAAFQDRCHQPYREPLVPGLAQLLRLEHPDLLGACLSGAGPSVVAFAVNHPCAIEALVADIYAGLGIPCEVRVLPVHQKGML